MSPTPGTARRKRLLAIAAAVTVIGGGGFLALHPVLADGCDPEVESTCLEVTAGDAVDWDAVTDETDLSDITDAEPIEDPADDALADADADIADTDADADADAEAEVMAPEEELPEDFTADAEALPAAQDEPRPWGPLIRAAIQRTEDALANRDCDNAVSGRGARASRVFANVVDGQRIFNYTHLYDPDSPRNPAAAGGGPTDGEIILYRPWISANAAKARHSGVSLDDDGWRSIILLHEVGHLTRSLPGDHTGMPGWEVRALKKCLL